MAHLQSPKIIGLALSLSIVAACPYCPSPFFLQSALGFDFGLGAIKDKVMHPFGGGDNKGVDQPTAQTDKDADKDTADKDVSDKPPTKKAPVGKASSDKGDSDSDKDQDSMSSGGGKQEKVPPKHQRTQEIEIPAAGEDEPEGKVSAAKAAKKDKSESDEPVDPDDPTRGKDLARTKRKIAPEHDSSDKLESEISHPKMAPKKYYDDEGSEMEESEYLDELEKKRKEKQLKDMLAPAGRPEDNDPEPHLTKARVLTKQGQFKPALTEINEALRLKPQYWEAHYQGALILQTMGRTKEAISQYKYLVDVKPDYIEAHINLGALLTKEGEFVAAEKEYKKAIDLNFYSLSAHYNLANLYIRQEKLNQAQKELMLCLKLKPTNAWVHNNLGVIFQKRNYLEDAEEEFLKALHLEPANKSFEANLYLVRSQLRKKPVRAGKTYPAETG